MGMTPTDYYEVFVVGNQADCTQEPGCLRRAFNAAISASHMADTYYEFNRRHRPELVAAYDTASKFATHLSNVSPAFRDIRSIANAYKHLYEDTGRKSVQHWSVASAGSLESVHFPKDIPLRVMKVDYGAGEELNCKVVFRRRDGTRGEFLPTLDEVVRLWLDKLYPD